MRKARLLLSLAFVAAAPLAAVDFVVTTYSDPFPDGCDPGDCSLREAVLDANAAAGKDRIFLSAGTYVVDRFGPVVDDPGLMGDLDVTDDLEILGAAATMTTILVEGLLEEGIHAESVSGGLLLRDLTLRDGDDDGLVLGPGTHRIERCTIRGHGFTDDLNDAGNGVTVNNATLTVVDSTIRDNKTNGIFSNGSTVTLRNSTFFSSNLRQLSFLNGSAASCHHCTLVADGANATVAVDDSELSLRASIVDGACAITSGGTISTISGNIESPGHSCNLSPTTDTDDVADPGLLAIGDNGGPTDTMNLESDSPAVGRVSYHACFSVDQRGAARVEPKFEFPCDAGAVERSSRPATPIFEDGFLQGDAGAWSTAVGVEPPG